jgi:large subunit ribosomal protein L23
MSLQPYDILRKPLVTEKSMARQQQATYTFIVATEANKAEVRAAVEKVYNVKVDQVRTVKVKGKLKRMKNMLLEGKRKDWKKAYVTLKEGYRLDIV